MKDNNGKGLRVLWIFASLSLLLGIILSLRGLARWEQGVDRIQRKIEHHQEVKVLLKEYQRHEPALQAIAAMEPQPALSLRAALRQYLPEVDVEIFQRETTVLADGWGMRRVDLSLDHASLEDIAEFVGWLERQIPPWRVGSLSIQSSDLAPGTGRISMTLMGLEHDTAIPR